MTMKAMAIRREMKPNMVIIIVPEKWRGPEPVVPGDYLPVKAAGPYYEMLL